MFLSTHANVLKPNTIRGRKNYKGGIRKMEEMEMEEREAPEPSPLGDFDLGLDNFSLYEDEYSLI